MLEFNTEELSTIANIIESAPADAAIYLDYQERKAIAVPHEDGHWPLETAWRYCFIGFAADLIEKLSK